MDTDRRVVLQVAAGGDAGLTSGDLAAKNAIIFLAGEGRAGVDVTSGALVGTFRLGMMGWNRQPPGGDWGHRTMLGFVGRFSREVSTIGPSIEYWQERVIARSFDRGLCMDEGEYRFHTLESGIAIDVGFAKGKPNIWTATIGGHYRWTGWAHVHPFTDCRQTMPAESSRSAR